MTEQMLGRFWSNLEKNTSRSIRSRFRTPPVWLIGALRVECRLELYSCARLWPS